MTNFEKWAKDLTPEQTVNLIGAVSCDDCPAYMTCAAERNETCRENFISWANAEAAQTAPVTNFGKVTESVEALARILADNSFCDDVCTANPCLNDKGEHLCIKYAKEWLESEVGDEK